ncbi:CCR4-NOT transcription complex subunit 1 [Geosmithia morbida]|uniref:General negative regulator of transcription subunit 1 n=1 Tax=Geosmithia morbida TaxID=1094350 RepID=A0A9P4YV91_9HYPO|nr:CCR4-NOT transcription complex subunit 1 [Geosmithia morbida]KAF4122680.1 CCR4-NOT transcription complex subunit 1 [Geosmithia morbida]
MVPPPRAGSFSPNPAAHSLQTGSSHSPHPSQTAAFSAGASPSTSSPTGTNSLTKIVVAQIYLLLSTIKDDKDRAKLDIQLEQLKKLIDEHGMEVFSKYFTRLVAGNAPQIFPGLNRPVANPGNYQILVGEMKSIAHDVDQAAKIAESIESGTEDIFRDFDLSTFMEHFKLDALEKTLLALAFKSGTRSDLKTKADAILSTNFAMFMDIISRPDLEAHADLTPKHVALTVERFLNNHPPNFNASSRRDLQQCVVKRYIKNDQAPPSEVLAAFDVARVLADHPSNSLARYIYKIGPEFTRDEETCISYLQNRPSDLPLSAEQVAPALTFASISQTQSHDVVALVAALRQIISQPFSWTDVALLFDQPTARISSSQFLQLFKALLPIAQEPNSNFDMQRLWGGSWNETEAQLSFVSAYASLSPDQLDATTIPGLTRSITIEDYANSPPKVQERAAVAVRHPLVSVAALTSIFNVALSSLHASQTIEAKRLFQEVVVPNLDIFLVSAFEVPRQSWAPMAMDTLSSLFENFLYKQTPPNHDFVLDSLWKKDKEWVTQRLIDAHAVKPLDLPLIFEHAVKHNWLDELVYLPNGFGIDLAALAHAEGYLDLTKWAQFNAERSNEISRTLLQFLMIKANLEIQFQRPPDGQVPTKTTTTLQVRTVSALLQILEDFLPKAPVQDLILVQRHCITAYPRLINYGEGYDDIIDAAGKEGNALPLAANSKMEEHYKKMYGDELQVRHIVDILDRYKHSREPLDQDVFACMIHGLFDEYNHYVDYPLEALATTAVLFGGIISHKLISDLPLKIGLGMILEAVRDHLPDDPMYKFGLQALMQLLVRFREWPGFCKQLLQIPGLQGTEAYKKAEETVREHEEDVSNGRNSAGTPHGLGFGSEPFTNGNSDESAVSRPAPAFSAISVDPAPPGAFEDPGEEAQDRIQFVLNNITENTLGSMYQELRDTVEQRHQQWFASHLVEERAKMQPNYHHVYLELIRFFQDNALWGEVLRETYISVARMLNSEATMQNSTERTHLKNLGGWLGLLTLARDRPIKHKNIAFKQLLIEAHDTKRLIVVIPFVCKVLLQGASSAVFRPPNPWLMDIIYLLIDLYHHAELKLNLKFEIEVLCKGLNLDHKSIEPSGEILNRPSADEAADVLPQDQLDAFENLSLNGLGPTVGNGLQSHSVAPTIPDLGPMITVPPANEMVVSTSRLHEIVLTALTRALQDIIQPVVDRSVTIAAISTIQMIRKDFVTEPDENRVRNSAINMVKATAGSLALVTSKEPLRANFTNYVRNLAGDLPSGLPEGTIIMCVNSNIDLACSIIEKQAEERAIPEIEEMIERDLESRRRHRATRPDEPYYDANASRWSMTIPNPYKLSPNINGLKPEQMAIYDEFGRQPRSTTASAAGPSHAPSTSDATRSLANEVLQEQYSTIPSLPTPAETPSVQHLGGQMQPYPPAPPSTNNSLANSRTPAYHLEMRVLVDRTNKLLQELLRVAAEAREDHFMGLPRPHPVLDVVDALVQLIIKASQSSEEFAIYAVEQISSIIFQQVDDNLTLESLVHVLETARKISGPSVNNRVRSIFGQQPGSNFLSLPLLSALIRTDLLDWKAIDQALSRALEARKDGSLEFLDHVLDLALLNNRPIALFADFVRTLEVAWTWINEEPGSVLAQRLKAKMMGPVPSQPEGEDAAVFRRDQMEYVFEEWVNLLNNYNATEKTMTVFIQQLHAKQVVRDRDDFFEFVRVALDMSVDRYEQNLHIRAMGDLFATVDALATLISVFVSTHTEMSTSRVIFLDAVLSLISMVIYHHQIKRGEQMNQRVFFRLLSMLLHQTLSMSDGLTEGERQQMLLRFAERFAGLGPVRLPAFVYAWVALLQHRAFLPPLLSMPNNEGWAPFAKLLSQLLDCIGEQLKMVNVSHVTKELYSATWKLLVVVQHDFPDFMSAHSGRFCASIPPHCTQLINTILSAQPQQSPERLIEDERTPSGSNEQAAAILRESGLLGMLDQALQDGPSEDVIAQVAHAMSQGTAQDTSYGNFQVAVNSRIVGAVVLHIGNVAAERLDQPGALANLTGSEPEVVMLSMLVHEVPPVVRYYLLSSIANQLRAPSGQSEFFTHALLYIFGKDMNDPEETELRQDITRILLERLGGIWPHPWGLMATVMELLKNQKYQFFELPFIKADHEVTERFMTVLRTGQ